MDQRSHRLRLNHLVHQSLQDWLTITKAVTHYPVPLTDLVAAAPTLIGTMDASKNSKGGFWLPVTNTTISTAPIVWCTPFLPTNQCNLVSTANPTGTLMNSNLELAVLLTSTTLAATHPTHMQPVLYCMIDTTPTLAWSTKDSTSSNAMLACLLHQHAQSAHQHDFALHFIYTPGSTNTLAHLCSHSFHLSGRDFLTVVNHCFPHQPSWKLTRPTDDILSLMNYALSKRMQPWASADPVPWQPAPPGIFGLPSVTPFDKTLTSLTTQIPSSSYNSLLGDTEQVPRLPAVLPSELLGALIAIGQMLATLGCPDPRLQPSGKRDLRLQRQQKAYSKLDPPPNHVKPIPFTIITQAAMLCCHAATDYGHTLAGVLMLGFYFLLHPGNPTCTANPESTPFRFYDIHLMRYPICLHPYTATEQEL